MPAGLVVLRINSIADARRNFEAEYERMQEILARNPVSAGIGEERRGDGRAGMNIVLWEGVIIVVDVGAEAVENRSQKWIESFVSAQNARVRGAAIGSKRRDCDVH